MNFEAELARLTLNANSKIEQYEQTLDAPRRKYKAQFDLTLKTKTIITNVCNRLVQFYPNAESEVTHFVAPETGEICPLMWTFDCCFLNFAKNATFEFPVPARFAVKVILSHDLSNIKLVSGLVYGDEAIEKNAVAYRRILSYLRYNKSYFYQGPLLEQEITKATELELLNLLKLYQEQINNPNI